MGVIVAVLNVVDRQGRNPEPEAVEGWQVMALGGLTLTLPEAA